MESVDLKQLPSSGADPGFDVGGCTHAKVPSLLGWSGGMFPLRKFLLMPSVIDRDSRSVTSACQLTHVPLEYG